MISFDGVSWLNAALAQSSAAGTSQTQSSKSPGAAELGGSAAGQGQAAGASIVQPGANSATVKKVKKKKGKGDDFSGDRDCNLFQLEPTVINERFYTSGEAEHHQKISPTLPFGAPVPDNEGPNAPESKPQKTSSADKPTEHFSDKLDGQVKASLTALKDVQGDSPTLKLKLRVSTVDDALLGRLKDLKADVISASPSSGDMIIYAPAKKVNDIGNISQVLIVLLAQ